MTCKLNKIPVQLHLERFRVWPADKCQGPKGPTTSRSQLNTSVLYWTVSHGSQHNNRKVKEVTQCLWHHTVYCVYGAFTIHCFYKGFVTTQKDGSLSHVQASVIKQSQHLKLGDISSCISGVTCCWAQSEGVVLSDHRRQTTALEDSLHRSSCDMHSWRNSTLLWYKIRSLFKLLRWTLSLSAGYQEVLTH